GMQWSSPATLQSSTVTALAGFDEDGPGPTPPKVFMSLGISGFTIQRLDNGSWTIISPFIPSGSVSAMAVLDDDGLGPHPPGLIVAGGFFSLAGSTPGLARWAGPAWQRRRGRRVPGPPRRGGRAWC